MDTTFFEGIGPKEAEVLRYIFGVLSLQLERKWQTTRVYDVKLAKKLQNLESHLNANDERFWLAQKLKALTLLLIGYMLPRVKTAVRHSNWLQKLFLHMKIERIDFYR